MHRSTLKFSLLKNLLQDTAPIVSNPVHGIITVRAYAGVAGPAEELNVKNNTTFKDVMNHRKNEAKRSILIQIHSEQSCDNLFDYFTKLCHVKNMFHYQALNTSHFALVELNNEDSVNVILDHAIHFQPHEVVPVKSPFLWFRATGEAEKTTETPYRDKIFYHNNITIDDKEKLENYLMNADSPSQQMVLLYEKTKISEVGTRLRFLTARQIEMGLSGLFPYVSVMPFGSSVNGFGKNNCDLDLVLNYVSETESDKSRLIYHAKSSMINERIQIQHHIEIIADILQLFMPGCTNVKKILQAKVPIIKYKQDLASLDCDLCMSNMSALQMSELLFSFSLADDRVQYLVFTVRYWAKEVGLTNPSPGRWITNFSLTLLVLFYLQLSEVSVLPTIKNLNKQRKVTNSQSLEELLYNFFSYYAVFDFSSLAISLDSGKPIMKPDYSALFIVNPLQPELNVSKNVSFEEVENLKTQMRNAVWTMDAFKEENCDLSDKKVRWGIVKLFEKTNASKNIGTAFFRTKNRLIDVQSLFDDESADGRKTDSILKKVS